LSGVIAFTNPNKFSLGAVIVIGILAEMGGSLTSYAIGRRGGRTLLERYGKFVLITRSDLDRAERFFSGRGSWVVAPARMLPLVRCFASFGAGVVEIPTAPFAIFSLIGTAIWVSAITLLGYNLGSTVTKFYHSFTVIGAILAVLLLGGLVAHRVHALRKEAKHDQGGPGNGGNSTGGTPSRPKVTSGRGGAHRSGRGPAS